MNIHDKRKQITSLINNIKEHSDRLMDMESLPLLEISVIQAKINKLHDATVILKYLTAKNHGKAETVFNQISEIDEMVEQVKEFGTVDSEYSKEVKTNEEEYLVDQEINQEASEAEDAMVSATLEKEAKEIEPLTEAPVENLEPTEATPNQDFINDPEVLPEADQVEDSPAEEALSAIKEQAEKVISVEKIDEFLADAEVKTEVTAKPDLNEAYTSEEDTSLSGQMQKTAIPDLISAIGLNERYLYANDLFDGDMERFKDAITTLNNFESVKEAKVYFTEELAAKNNWDYENPLTKALENLVERRFQ